ncbi:MAG: oligosaccharide flippase family protein [Acutalibacteraceae bacterium]|nr:oligosaccharide flippase family protein [Acutalibacteraceae bacterium]
MEKLKLNQVRMGALISYFALGINVITGLLYTPWMVRQIGQSNYGLYSLATSLIAIFMLDFGLGSAVSRFVSKYRAESNQEAINSIIGVIYKLYMAIDIVILCVLTGVYFFLDVIYVKLTPAELEQFRTLYLMVAAFNLISFPLSPLNGLLNAYEKFIQLKICDLLHKLFTVGLVVVALSVSTSVTMVVAANVASGLITLLLKFIIVKQKVPVRVNFKAGGKELYKSLFGFTAWTTVISLMQRFTHSFAPSVLGMTASAVEIAIYSPAVVLEGYYYLLATAVNGLFLPRVSRFIAEGKEDEILKLMIKVGKYQIVVLGLIFIGFLCVGQDFMTLWMGPDYAKTYYCALIILFPTLISSTQQIASTTVIAKNLVKYQAKCMTITGVVGLVISYALSMFVGSLGVCIGTAVTALTNMVYMNTIYYRKAGINVFEFYKKVYLKAVPCYAIVAIIGLIVTRFITFSGWMGLIIKAATVSVIYLTTLGLLYLSKQDRCAILNRIKKR